MDPKKRELIHSRNSLMAKILWVCLILDIVTITMFYKIDHLFRPVPVPAGLVIATLVTVLVRKKKMVSATMFLIMGVIFLYLFALVKSDPFLCNFMFIWFGLVLSSLYHDYRLIVFSGSAAIFLTNYFFINFRQQMFPVSSDFELAFFNLFGVLVTIILVITSKFSEELRLKAQANESEAVGRLHTHQQFTESFINNTSDAIEVTDLDGTLLLANRAYEDMFGWKIEDVIGEKTDLIPPECREETNALLGKVRIGKNVNGFETVRLRKDGTMINVSVTISPVRDHEGYLMALSCIYRDVTERKKTEEILRKSDKLSVVGQLAAGVAHEIRNPLTAIKGFVQILRNRENPVDSNEPRLSKNRAAYYDIILSETERIETIIREFLVLSKPQAVSFNPADLNDLLRNVILLAEPRAAISGITLIRPLEANIPQIECDENQLKQVFVNVLNNAIEATPDGGNVVVKVRPVDPEVISIAFTDHGCGIPEDRLRRLGEPFYSTKEKGTGLGLLVSYKIVENHQGRINVTSKVGEGTTFEIILPVKQPMVHWSMNC